MKVIHINASYKPAYIYGGPALSISKLCEALADANTDIEVLTTTANGKEELPVDKNKQVLVDGVKVTYFKRLTKDHTHFSPGLLSRLRNIIKEHGAAGLVIHIHAWWNLVSVFSCFIARLYKVPVILTPRGTLSNYSFGNRNAGIKDYIHRYLGESLLKYCDFHVTSAKEKEDILRLVEPKTITVIPNFVYLPKIDPEILAIKNEQILNKQKPKKLLFLSRIEEKKGLDILFRALAGIEIPYELSIAGTGEADYIEYLKKLTVDLQIEDKVFWLGQKNQTEKWDVLKQHNLLVLTSYDENFANVVIECLAMGTPVLVSDKVGLADYVKDTGFGWLCQPEAGSIKERLVEALNNDIVESFTRKNSPQKIREDFDENVLIKDFLMMYSRLTGA